MKCPVCGTKLQGRYCPTCGGSTVDASEIDPHGDASKTPKSEFPKASTKQTGRAFLVAVVIVFTVAAAIAAILFSVILDNDSSRITINVTERQSSVSGGSRAASAGEQGTAGADASYAADSSESDAASRDSGNISASSHSSSDIISAESSASDTSITDSQSNAVSKAKSYLEILPLSRESLISVLEVDNFSREDAVYGVDNCGADWNEQAVKKAKLYLDVMSFSREQLINQLEFEGFTHEQAVYGAEANGL